ncbi:hypothetical protein [Corynebacterium striatum]|uniref:hypothetical protein n=1 Tax=Corynebacterium striatum TaxID=43770 RepID=UPI001C0F035B|nr:hypothetical protein [Corynebacterium striatum]
MAEACFEDCTLLIVGHALSPESVYGPFQRMHQHGLAMAGKRSLNILRPRHDRTIAELDGDFLTVAVNDAVELVQIHNRRGMNFYYPAIASSCDQSPESFQLSFCMTEQGAEVGNG